MITKELENKKPDLSTKLSSTVRSSTFEALNKEAEKTGNRSFLVDKAIRLLLGLEDDAEQELEKAS